MFGQKSTFGQSTSTFGGFNAGASTSSPFGSSAFGKPAAPATGFGAAPAFGTPSASTAAPSGGLFGSTATPGSTLFGSTATAAPAFGAAPAAPTGFGGFGQPTANTSGLFGQTANQSGGLFGQTQQQQQTGFGAKPAGFAFGSTAGNTSLFGQTNANTSGLFGQTNTALGSGGGLFGANTGFGQQQQSGTGHVKYNPVCGTDLMTKNGQSQTINIKHQCITCMKEYESKSFEELRLEDYVAGRKGAQQAPGGFGAAPATNAFNTSFTENKPAGGGLFGGQGGFGSTTPAFGAATSNTSTSLFGGAGAFGAKPATTNTGFGGFGTAQPTTGLGTGLFGSTTSQPAPAFGTNTSTFGGFGTANQTQQSTGLFGAKPATTGSTFGGFGTSTAGTGGLFGAKPAGAAPAFGSTAPAFGSTAPAFGAATSNTGGSLFGGGGAFGAKPATTNTSFGGFNATPSATGLGLGSSFQSKPLFPSFGATAQQNTTATPAFGGFGTGSTFGGGLNTGLGGALGGSTLGQPQQQATWASPNQSSVHEQILALVARPYGDQPLFKDLKPDMDLKSDEAFKAPGGGGVPQKASIDNTAYKVSPPGVVTRLKVKPLATQHARNKKSLFDGLEENDPSLDCKLSLKPTRKRLVLRIKPNDSAGELHGSNEVNGYNFTANRQEEPTAPPKSDVTKTAMDDVAEGRGSSPNRSKDGERQTTPKGVIESPRGINADLQDESRVNWLTSKGSLSPGELDRSGLDESLGGTGRLYPSLDNLEMPERRSSWLSSKPLLKQAGVTAPNQEISVADLKLARSVLDAEDKENIISVNEEDERLASEVIDSTPHPTGIKLRRPGYYTIPSMDDLLSYLREDSTCVVPHFTIGRKGYGNIYYDCEMDVANLDLDELVHILNKEVIVYPSDSQRPPMGQGLNRRAVITLDRVWPRDKTLKQPITDPERLAVIDYEGKLRRVCDKHNTKFIEYRPQTGSWVFRVEHFSKYGLTDSDEEDDVPAGQQNAKGVTQQTKLLIQQQALQKSGLGGLALQQLQQKQQDGFAADFSGVMHPAPPLHSTAMLTMDSAVDETGIEQQTLYPESRGLKSPTSFLARMDNRSNHQLQLMKASLYYNDTEEDMAEVTMDQTVPIPGAVSRLLTDKTAVKFDSFVSDGDALSESRFPIAVEEPIEVEPIYVEEPRVKPLHIPPETFILKTHGQVVPYKQTLAGNIDSSCHIKMLIGRSRHSRVGFGPGAQMALLTTRQVADGLFDAPRDHTSLGLYVAGRSEYDFSPHAVARLRIAGGTAASDPQLFISYIQPHLLALLDHSTVSAEIPAGTCPKLVPPHEPSVSLSLLKRQAEIADKMAADMKNSQISDRLEYNNQIWMLCEALYEIDLENGGTAPQDTASVLAKSRALTAWFKHALGEHTRAELERDAEPDPIDETDGHSRRVLALLLGGRIVEACTLARKCGDYNMAAILAQAGGDPMTRQLLERQLKTWESISATERIGRDRLTIMRLLCGQPQAAPSYWLSALAAHYWYTCQQISTIQEAIKTFESTFDRGDSDESDLERCDNPVDFERLPKPPYHTAFSESGEKKRLILDLRYQLMKNRAVGSRTFVHPQSHTDDPLDYCLSFILGSWLGTLTPWAIIGIADQLEAAGSWHLAIMALMYHPNDSAREHLVKACLSRNVSARDEHQDKMDFVLERLALPRAWLLKARAGRAKYERLWSLEAKYLAEASEWNGAHRVLMDKLLPKAVLSEKLEQLHPLLEQLNDASEADLVSGWDSGGAAPYNYVKVCQEIRRLVETRCCELDRLSTYVTKAALALAKMDADDAPHRAAKCEMGARLVQLSLSEAGSLGVAGGRVKLARLLERLRLPPDYLQHALDVIVTGAAEEASELVSRS